MLIPKHTLMPVAWRLGFLVRASDDGEDTFRKIMPTETETDLIPLEKVLGTDPWIDDLSDELAQTTTRNSRRRHQGDLSQLHVEEAGRGGFSEREDRSRGAGPVLLALGGIALCFLSYKLATNNRAPVRDTIYTAATTVGSARDPDSVLGHRRHDEAPAGDLRPISPGSSVWLRSSAARAFDTMRAAAMQEGVEIIPISGCGPAASCPL
ncbi:hypothetical protein CYMTET_5498 [Cymbomonas tetramitiformis]|uniref:Uncharacterized protein n=1 Tax=Cymbomonas tetramitiformis TaxID=36881 RepID=A0AAE0GZD7_9CHLO|nr:hypothetical protein CYMTET_5498 [Cymbomonas tetramitiformis]